MFIARQGDLIIQSADTKAELEEKIKLCPNCTIEETDINYQNVCGEFVTPEVAEQKEKERVAMLKMTPRDFLLACTQQFGIEWSAIKALMDSNPQVAIELQFCNFVYRGNPLLDQLCGNFNVTSEQLDELFKKANSEETKVEG